MQSKRQKGIELNKLLRYKAIQDCYLQHKTDDIPTTVIYRKYIYPRFFISRTTLYTILATPINKRLKELKNRLN
jgi:hypothetical protein